MLYSFAPHAGQRPIHREISNLAKKVVFAVIVRDATRAGPLDFVLKGTVMLSCFQVSLLKPKMANVVGKSVYMVVTCSLCLPAKPTVNGVFCAPSVVR